MSFVFFSGIVVFLVSLTTGFPDSYILNFLAIHIVACGLIPVVLGISLGCFLNFKALFPLNGFLFKRCSGIFQSFITCLKSPLL